MKTDVASKLVTAAARRCKETAGIINFTDDSKTLLQRVALDGTARTFLFPKDTKDRGQLWRVWPEMTREQKTIRLIRLYEMNHFSAWKKTWGLVKKPLRNTAPPLQTWRKIQDVVQFILSSRERAYRWTSFIISKNCALDFLRLHSSASFWKQKCPFNNKLTRIVTSG